MKKELKKQLVMSLVVLKEYKRYLKYEYSRQDEVDEEIESFLEKSEETMDNLIDLISWLEEE